MSTEVKNKQEKKQRRRSADVPTMVYGKVPPQAKDIEQAILGAMLIDKMAIDTVMDMLKEETFYVEAHQMIFAAIKRLVGKSQPIDILTVSEELRSSEQLDAVGGSFYLTTLTSSVVSSANISAHCKIVIQKHIQRELIRVSGEILGAAYEDMTDPFELLDMAEETFTTIGQSLDFGSMTPIDTVLVEAIRKIEDWRQRDSSITGVPSGFSDLDKATRGWQDGDLIIIAARPSVGKTAFALNIVRNAAMAFMNSDQNKSVAVWSLEMKSVMLILRMLAAESKQILYRIQTGKLTDAEMKMLFKEGIQKLARLKIFFDDKSVVTLQRLRSKARKMKRKNNLGLIVVDYLQLMTPEEKSGTREQEVSKISRGLKNLAQELNVPIIALSQMSRDFEKRTGAARIPQLSDLRESGSIEQDADVIVFLWGPTDADMNNDASLIGRRFVKIAKQRNGMLLTTNLDFKDEMQLFEEIVDMPKLGLPTGSWRPVDYTEPDKGDDNPF